MTESEYQSTTEVTTTTELPKMSGVAVASLVSSLILCCPVTTVVGLILGVVGFFMTGSGKRRGRGLAIAGFVIGAVTTVAWVIGGTWVWNAGMKVVLSGPDLVMKAGVAGDDEEARSYFAAGHEPSAEEIAAFVKEAEGRYGAFISAEIKDDANAAQPGGEVFDLPYLFRFKNEQREAAVTFHTVSGDAPAATASGSYVGIVTIKIVDKEAGKIVLRRRRPEPADEPAP
jgi:hypothetical protein